MKSKLLAGCLLLSTLTIFAAGCSNSEAQTQKQKDQAAIDAKAKAMADARQNPHIPDWVKARMGATAQPSSK